MLKAKVLEVNGFMSAIHGMRNPMNSWGKSDSKYCCEMECENCPLLADGIDCANPNELIIGKNDLDLMLRLCKAGTEHRKYLRMINVYLDITAPLYWWKEFDTYKIGTVCNSCSTMHKIHSRDLILGDFSLEHISEVGRHEIARLISHINYSRKMYLETKDKDWWWEMIQLLPSSYNQTRTIMLNYETILNIIRQRKNHKLDEWHQLIDVFMALPLVDELVEAM